MIHETRMQTHSHSLDFSRRCFNLKINDLHQRAFHFPPDASPALSAIKQFDRVPQGFGKLCTWACVHMHVMFADLASAAYLY